MLDDWVADLRMRASSWSTVRGYKGAIRRFCWFITDPAYSWSVDCERIFGTHPVQVCQDGNMMVHVAETESVPAKRAFTVEELQTFLDYADAQVQTARTAGRKGWLGTFRDAVLFKVAYAWGLRRNETRSTSPISGPTRRRRNSAATASATCGTAKPAAISPER